MPAKLLKVKSGHDLHWTQKKTGYNGQDRLYRPFFKAKIMFDILMVYLSLL
jgi:hypothetical protein